jgi:DNA-binding beta-propeller fold protein YncE
MKRIIPIMVAAAIATVTCDESPTLHGWVYGGDFYDFGPGRGDWPGGLLPLGVAVLPHSGIVYVAIEGATKPYANRIEYFTPNGWPLGRFEGEGSTYFYDVAVSPSEDWVYAVAGGDSRILYYTALGSLLGGWDVNRPTAIAVSRFDGTVYVAGDNRIRYFTGTGSYLGEWGTEGSREGQFKKIPWGIDVAPDTGYVYVADTGNDRIQYFNSSGSFVGKWGATGSGKGNFKEPTDVAVSPADGKVYVVDRGNNRVQNFTPDGSFVGTLGSYGTEEARFYYPWALCFNGTGNRLYVTESPCPRVQYFDYYE